MQTLSNAFAAGYLPDVYLEICPGMDAASQINLVSDQINNQFGNDPNARFNGVMYLKVQPNSNPGCSWDRYNQIDNCDFLVQAAIQIWNVGWFPGVFSTARIWQQLFGSSCNNFAGDTFAKLWYANYDSKGRVN